MITYVLKSVNSDAALKLTEFDFKASWLKNKILPAAIRQWDKIADYRSKRLAVHDMRRLDNHTLKDIGIDRSEIVSVVNGNSTDPSRIRNTLLDKPGPPMALSGNGTADIVGCGP